MSPERGVYSAWIDYLSSEAVFRKLKKTMAVTEQALLSALSSVLDPHTGKDFVSTRAVSNLQIHGDDVAFDVEMGYPAQSLHAALRSAFIAAAKSVAGVGNVSVNITEPDADPLGE